MAYTLTIPFFAFRLKLHSAGGFLSPMSDATVLHTNSPLEILAGKYANAFQTKVLDKGDFTTLLSEKTPDLFYKAPLPVSFKKASDGFSFPAFELDFDYYYSQSENGCWGIIPALGIEAFGEDLKALEESLYQTVRLDFSRKKRLQDVHDIVSAIWYDSTELLRHDLELKFHTPRELEKLQQGEGEKLLPRIAKLLKINKQVVYEYQNELDQLVRGLKNKFTQNILLVGPTGVGKTALVWEMVHQSKKRKIHYNIWETTASVMIKELTGETGWQDSLASLCRELIGSNDILFVRNLLELFEVGQYSGNEVSVAEYLRAYISRGDISIISECSEEEKARIELRAPNFLSYFQVINIEEPRADLEKIVLQKTRDLASIKNIKLEKKAVEEGIRLHKRFQPYAGFPGKPIRFLESLLLNSPIATNRVVGRKEVVANFSEETGMPLFMLDPEVPMEPQKVKNKFNTQVFGQELAVDNVVDTLSTVKTALSRSGKPIASFLFVGPTGVGKTELAKVLSHFMFGSRERMLRFDMSEFSDPYSVMRLLGESFFQDGLLTSAVRREPFCVLLFDEIEKAHPSFYDLLLQILGEGRLTDSRGKLVNFCSTLIIMTSNIGAGFAQQSIVSWNESQSAEELGSHFQKAVEKHFRPELFNRIDKVIPFQALSKTTLSNVMQREIQLLRQREGIRFRNMDLHIEDAALELLAEKGYDPKYGARQLQRTIREMLVIPLSQQLNLLDFDDRLLVNVGVVNQDTLDIQIEVDPQGMDLLMEELDKINFADYSSSLRRKIGAFKEGHFYNGLISKLDILEREKARTGKSFWEDGSNNIQYLSLIKSQETLNLLIAEIEQLEADLSRSCLGLQSNQPDEIEKVKAWEKKFREFKKELFFAYTPLANRVFFTIYGSDLDPILDFYLQLFARKKFTWEAKTIWYRESFYLEELPQRSMEPEGANGENQSKEAYIEKAFVGDADNNFKPLQKGDLLYGIRFHLTGDGVQLFLEGEEGLHRWKISERDIFNYQVTVDRTEVSHPLNIHRREFYKGNPRRTIEPGLFKDARLKIKKEIDARQLLERLLKILEKEFLAKLNAELGGN